MGEIKTSSVILSRFLRSTQIHTKKTIALSPSPLPPPQWPSLFKFFFLSYYHKTTAPPTTPINIQTQVFSAAPTKDVAIEGFVVEEGVAASFPVLVVEEVLEPELDDPDPPTGPPVPLALTVPVQVATETPVLFLHGPAEAEDRKVMSAQLYSPPLGSPLVTTWIVAV